MAADGTDSVVVKRLGELADISTQTLTKLEQTRTESIEAGKKLDERLKVLESRGQRTNKRSAYLDAMRSEGKAAEADVEERIESAVSDVESQTIDIGEGRRIALITKLPRGLAGVQEGRGLVAVRMMRMIALAQATGADASPNGVLDLAAKHLGPADVAVRALEEQRDVLKKAGTDKDFATRALGTQIVGSGAGFIGAMQAQTFIDFLFATSWVRRLGAVSLPLTGNGGDAAITLDTAVTVAYRDEQAAQNESSPQDGAVNVIRRILSGTIALSNEFLAEASWAVDAIIRTHMGRAMTAFADRRMMLGRGVGSEIRGMDWWVEQPTTAHFANRSLATGAVTVQTVMQDFANGIGRITSENKALFADEGGRPGCIMSDRDARGLMIASEGSGGAISRPFKDEVRGGSIFGLPLGRSNQLPLTDAGDAAGTGTNNKSRVFIADFSSLAIYEREGIRVEAFRGGSYRDASGNLQSGVSNRMTVLTADMDHDFVDLYRGRSIATIRSVDWGPAFGVSI